MYALSATQVAADELRVAVSSNFYPTMKLIAIIKKLIGYFYLTLFSLLVL